MVHSIEEQKQAWTYMANKVSHRATNVTKCKAPAHVPQVLDFRKECPPLGFTISLHPLLPHRQERFPELSLHIWQNHGLSVPFHSGVPGTEWGFRVYCIFSSCLAQAQVSFPSSCLVLSGKEVVAWAVVVSGEGLSVLAQTHKCLLVFPGFQSICKDDAFVLVTDIYACRYETIE